MGKEMKRAVKPEAELPPEFDPRNDAEAQVRFARRCFHRPVLLAGRASSILHTSVKQSLHVQPEIRSSHRCMPCDVLHAIDDQSMRLMCSSQHDPPGHFHVCTCT